MCDYGWDGKDLNSGSRYQPPPRDRAAEARRANALFLERVVGRRLASTITAALIRENPDIERSTIRAALWHHVGMGKVKFHWDGTVERP